jgi:hypothetical protein
MSIEAMKLALDALETHGAPLLNHEDAYSASLTALRQAIKEALAQPEQEPDDLTIAYMSGFHDGKNKDAPQREWVGLTYLEIDQIYCDCHDDDGRPLSIKKYERAIEAKLREKNGC